MRRAIALIVAFGFVLASAPDTRADDLCFRYRKSGGGTLVARGVTLPRANTCVPLALFENGGLSGAATGSICVNEDSSTVIFHYTYDSCVGPAYFESATCLLRTSDRALPAAASTCRGTYTGGAFLEIDDAILENCSGIVMDRVSTDCIATFAPHRTPEPAPPKR
jgi:hypothetical protein